MLGSEGAKAVSLAEVESERGYSECMSDDETKGAQP